MNWPLIIVVGVASLALILFMIYRNKVDKKDLEHRIKEDYHKPTAEYTDVDIEERKK